VSFICKASGNPTPDVFWRKGGKRITSTRSRFLTLNIPHGSVLRIEPVKSPRDDTVVECVADNGIGEPAAATAKLEIYTEGEGKREGNQGVVLGGGCPVVAVTLTK